jgi:predicted DNA-binding protein YlxM (UPF0122 family)
MLRNKKARALLTNLPTVTSERQKLSNYVYRFCLRNKENKRLEYWLNNPDYALEGEAGQEAEYIKFCAHYSAHKDEKVLEDYKWNLKIYRKRFSKTIGRIKYDA